MLTIRPPLLRAARPWRPAFFAVFDNLFPIFFVGFVEGNSGIASRSFELLEKDSISDPTCGSLTSSIYVAVDDSLSDIGHQMSTSTSVERFSDDRSL